jgi:hypothetical protein
MDHTLVIAAVALALAALDVTAWLHAATGGSGARTRRRQRRA